MRDFIQRNIDGHIAECLVAITTPEGEIKVEKRSYIIPKLPAKKIIPYLQNRADSENYGFVRLNSLLKVHIHGGMTFEDWVDNATLSITEYDDESEDNE